jgi:tetratricopeptide (TPR) repeat protein
VHRAHAQHFLHVAETANLSIDALGRGPQRPEIVLREQHNVRAALDWLAEADPETGLRLMVTVENFWVTQALDEGIRRYEQLLARAQTANHRLLASATRDYGAFHDVTGRLEEARAAYQRSRELFEQAGDAIGVANLDFRLGIVAVLSGDVARGKHLWEHCLATFTELGDPIGRIQALGNLGAYELDHGDFARGRVMVEEALELAREAGWHWWQARSWGDLAERLVLEGELDEAESFGRRYLEYVWGTANRQETLLGLAILARAASARGDADRALALWSAVEAVEDGPGRFGHFDRAEYARAMPDRPHPEPLALDDAVALALS